MVLFDSITPEYLVISDLQGYFDNFRFPGKFIGQDFILVIFKNIYSFLFRFSFPRLNSSDHLFRNLSLYCTRKLLGTPDTVLSTHIKVGCTMITMDLPFA